MTLETRQQINIKKQFFKYVSLNILAMIGTSCYILADTFFIANGVGADGLTALNVAISLYSYQFSIALCWELGVLPGLPCANPVNKMKRGTKCSPRR